MIERYFVHSVVRVRPAVAADRYGDARADWAGASRLTLKGWLSDRATTELRDGREAIVSDAELSLPGDADVAASDRFEASGVTYEVVGDVVRAATPRGTHHLVLNLRTFRG